jgi:hypothetical protein
MGSVGLSSVAIGLAGVVAALAYFVWRMYEERSFYKNMVSEQLATGYQLREIV